MIAAKLSGTYSKWLLTKEGSELKYNEKKFVKGAADSGEWLLSNIMRNNTKSRNQRLKASNLIANVDYDEDATVAENSFGTADTVWGGEENCADATGGADSFGTADTVGGGEEHLTIKDCSSFIKLYSNDSPPIQKHIRS